MIKKMIKKNIGIKFQIGIEVRQIGIGWDGLKVPQDERGKYESKRILIEKWLV